MGKGLVVCTIPGRASGGMCGLAYAACVAHGIGVIGAGGKATGREKVRHAAEGIPVHMPQAPVSESGE